MGVGPFHSSESLDRSVGLGVAFLWFRCICTEGAGAATAILRRRRRTCPNQRCWVSVCFKWIKTISKLSFKRGLREIIRTRTARKLTYLGGPCYDNAYLITVSAFGKVVGTSTPSVVTSTSSSIRTPPTEGK